MAVRYSVGIDIGGTHVRVLVLDQEGRRCRFVKTLLPADLSGFLKKLWKKWHVQGCSLVVASRGVWTVEECRAAKATFSSLAKRVEVFSDVEMAHRAALGGGRGIVISAGTGSIIYGVDDRSRHARRGGLGSYLGDEGSGFWLGREYLNHGFLPEAAVREIIKSPNPVLSITRYANAVFLKAKAGNKICAVLLNQAQEKLALMTQSLSKDLHFSGEIPLSWAGGLMEHRSFREGVFARLPRGRFHVIEPLEEPVVAAAKLAHQITI